MAPEQPRIVRSAAGHDKGLLFCVLDQDGPYLLLCDGRRRKAESPKRKKAVHTVDAGDFQHPVLEKIQAGEPITNREVRRALAAFRAEELRRV